MLPTVAVGNGNGNCWIAPAVVIRPIAPVSPNQSAPSGPVVMHVGLAGTPKLGSRVVP